MPIEEWRDIPEFEGLYQVSSEGNVRSLSHLSSNAKRYKGRMLKSATGGKQPYAGVRLSNGAIKKHRTVHTLVAEAFLGPRPDGMVINHIDGNKRNNRASNLEYCTFQDNVRHAMRNNLLNRGENVPTSKFTEAQAKEVLALSKQGKKFSEIAALTGISPRHVRNIAKGECWGYLQNKCLRGKETLA